MQYLAALIFFLCVVPSSAVALEYSFPVPTRPYEVIGLGGDVTTKHEYYGELAGDPIMYEVVLESTTDIAVQLSQVASSSGVLPLRLLVVEVLPSGQVKEVTRFTGEEWRVSRDSVLALTWHEAPLYEAELPAGMYRLEVSSPLNEGRYRLTLGTEGETGGYFTTWKRLGEVRSFFGLSPLPLFSSTFLLAHFVLALVTLLCWRFLWPRWRDRPHSEEHPLV